MTLYVLLILFPLLMGLWAQLRVSSVFSKYAQVRSQSGMTGAQVAALVLKQAGIQDVEIVRTPGHLTDHYDPYKKQLALSDATYSKTSVAALGVAAHEAGHAIQDQERYGALRFRMALIPVTQLASQLLPFVMIGGFFFGMLGLLKLGILVYLVLTVFQLVTLPVEFDASFRAKRQLTRLGVINSQEFLGVERVLNAAALTYVAAFVASLGNLIYLFLSTRNRE